MRRRTIKAVLQKLDHCSIYLLIAGSYTPVALVSLRGAWGWSLLGVVWGLALLGIAQEIWWARGARVLSLVIYVLMGWLALVAVVRAEFLRTRNFDYVQASRALGVSSFDIMRLDVLPNAMVAALTFLPFILTGSITTLTSLDFLGFGLPAGSPSLGELLAQGKANLNAPWLGLSGFFALVVMLTLLIFIGEGVRDAFDSRRAVTSVDAKV